MLFELTESYIYKNQSMKDILQYPILNWQQMNLPASEIQERSNKKALRNFTKKRQECLKNNLSKYFFHHVDLADFQLFLTLLCIFFFFVL